MIGAAFKFVLRVFVLGVLVGVIAVLCLKGKADAAPVSATPVAGIPSIPSSPSGVDYEVRAFHQVGTTMYAGGRFPAVLWHGNSYRRSNVVAFDSATGAVKPFAPSYSGEVFGISSTPDGNVEIAGESGLVKYRPDGSRVTSFLNPFSTTVRAVTYSCGRLYVGGDFDHLWSVDPNAGALLSERAAIGGVYSDKSGVTRIEKIVVAPNCSELAVSGVFTSISGQPHRQVARLSIPLGINPWNPPTLNGNCSTGAPYWARDMDYSPNSASIDVVTSGGSSSATNVCDALLRYNLPSTSLACINKTGDDSLYSVKDVGPYVYVAGHERWTNNPYGINSAGPGALDSPGIGGLTLSCAPIYSGTARWNPGRSRGIGAKVLYATSAGLWVGSDTREGDVLGCANPVAGIDCRASYLNTGGNGLHGHGGIGLLPI